MNKVTKTRKTKTEEKEFLPSLKFLIVKEIKMGNLSVEDARNRYGVQKESTIIRWMSEYEIQ